MLVCPTVAIIAPYESEGVYGNLIGGKHVIHFSQSYWKKIVMYRFFWDSVFVYTYCITMTLNASPFGMCFVLKMYR